MPRCCRPLPPQKRRLLDHAIRLPSDYLAVEEIDLADLTELA